MVPQVRLSYHSSMRIEDELAGLRRFLSTLEDPRTEYRFGGRDVRDREVGLLRREIAFLEGVLGRREGSSGSS